MSLRWAESNGQYHANTGNVAGLFGATVSSIGAINPAPISSTLVARNGSTWGYGQNARIISPNIGGVNGFSGMIAGGAYYSGGSLGAFVLIAFGDNNGNTQCDLRTNASGQLLFTRNGTNLGAGNLSTNALAMNTWYYIEFKAAFATGATGTCEVVVNGVTWLTLTNVQNANTIAKGWLAGWQAPNSSNQAWMDFYVLDTDSGAPNNTYLGDVTVAEIYNNGAGVNAAWTVNQASFALTQSANASGGTTVYTGTITNGASPANAWQGYYFSVTGFGNGANNGGPWLCTASTATTITLQNPSGVAQSGQTGTCAFQNPLQQGIHGGIVDNYAITNNGIRPGVVGTSENQYIKSSTPNQKADFAHQAMTLTGTINGVIHRTLARKDDAGARSIKQLCESGGTEELSATIALSSSYSYYDDILELDPNTGAAWTAANFNAATFGVKEMS